MPRKDEKNTAMLVLTIIIILASIAGCTYSILNTESERKKAWDPVTATEPYDTDYLTLNPADKELALYHEFEEGSPVVNELMLSRLEKFARSSKLFNKQPVYTIAKHNTNNTVVKIENSSIYLMLIPEGEYYGLHPDCLALIFGTDSLTDEEYAKVVDYYCEKHYKTKPIVTVTKIDDNTLSYIDETNNISEELKLSDMTISGNWDTNREYY